MISSGILFQSDEMIQISNNEGYNCTRMNSDEASGVKCQSKVEIVNCARNEGKGGSKKAEPILQDDKSSSGPCAQVIRIAEEY